MFCDSYVERFRMVWTQIKRASTRSTDYIIISVLRDMLLSEWCIQIYIPRTCRTLCTQLREQQLEDTLKPDFLNRNITIKHIFYFENPNMGYFRNYIHFKKRAEAIKIDSLTTDLLAM
jgi:hypothetical protein